MMLPDARFVGLPRDFWANVRAISEQGGYLTGGIRADKKKGITASKGSLKVYTIEDIAKATRARGLDPARLYDEGEDRPTATGAKLVEYLTYRAEVLNSRVEPNLMDAESAAETYASVRETHPSGMTAPMNKQKGEKKAPAYLTGIVNILIEANLAGLPCNYAPRKLTLVTREGSPLRTLSRWMDGCFPDTVNPIGIWEVKEYYYTTTFGSRVADGVYESLLDGMELEELRAREGIHIDHLLIVDSHRTWWKDGRPYLCRLVDLLHMGYADEILFGREVLDRLPHIIKRWVALYRERLSTS